MNNTDILLLLILIILIIQTIQKSNGVYKIVERFWFWRLNTKKRIAKWLTQTVKRLF